MVATKNKRRFWYVRLFSRFVSHHPWVVLIIWLLITIISLPFAAKAPSLLRADPASGVTNTESAHVVNVLREEFGETDSNTVILYTESNPPLSSKAGKATYDDFIAGLRKLKDVTRVLPTQEKSILTPQTADGTRALTLAQIPLEQGNTEALERIRTYAAQFQATQAEQATQATQAEQTEQTPILIKITGEQAIANDFTHYSESDTRQSELYALPLIALVVLVVFGALVATGLPLIVGLLSISAAMAGLYFLGHFMSVSIFAQSVVTVLGLAAGIDYALLMVNRFREELVRGKAAAQAAEVTILTAGRSVAFSGLTIAIAMSGLIVPPVAFVRSIGIGGVLVICFAVVASISALPAVLTLLGHRVNSPRILNITWAQSGQASAKWTQFARRVTKRPLLAVLGSSLFLLLLSVPTMQIKTGYASAWGLVEGVASRDALKDVQKMGAGGLLSQFEVLIDLQGERYSPANSQRFLQVVRDLEALEGVKTVISPFIDAQNLGGSLAGTSAFTVLSALNKRSFSEDRTYLRVTVIPDDAIPTQHVHILETRLREALDASGYQYFLGGAPIGGRDFDDAIMNTLPVVVTSVFVGTFLLLMVAFRSILIPLKSILMNILTVTAAIGITKLVVQDGWFAGFLGIPTDVGVLDSSLPILLFAVMFGLSMDYEIFLLSRVQEEYLRGASNDEAVVLAVGHTARIITSAALIMFVVFAAFMFGRVVATKSIGLGLTVAVVLDATLVRLVLVPAFLKWAGKWNWWIPAWLDKRLPHIKLEH